MSEPAAPLKGVPFDSSKTFLGVNLDQPDAAAEGARSDLIKTLRQGNLGQSSAFP